MNILAFPARPRCELCGAATAAGARLCSGCGAVWREESDGTFVAGGVLQSDDQRRWQQLAEALERGKIRSAWARAVRQERIECGACGKAIELAPRGGIWIAPTGAVTAYVLCSRCTAQARRNAPEVLARVEARLGGGS